MLKRTVTPLTQLDRRVPECGRIRMGVKVPLKNPTAKAKDRPKALDTWRFTSPHRDLIDAIAEHYGGTSKPWHDDTASPADQFEVITEANAIRVLVVPDGISIWYELWSAGGCKRRCDGVECEQPQMVGESDYEMVKTECICHQQGMAECDPHTRLQVVLPEFSFAGAWRFETKGWNAAQELPGMYDLVNAVHSRGSMIDATLSIESRERMTPTGKRNFKVPKLSVRNTPLEIAAGAGGLAVGGGNLGGTPALGTGQRPPADDPDVARSDDDEPVDAEVVTPELLEAEALLRSDALNFGLDAEAYVAAVKAGARNEKDDVSVERMRECSRMVRAGELVPLGFKSNGRVQWKP